MMSVMGDQDPVRDDRARAGMRVMSNLTRAWIETSSRSAAMLAFELAGIVPDTCIVTLGADCSESFDHDPEIATRCATLMTRNLGRVFEPALDLVGMRSRLPGVDPELLAAIGARGIIAVPLRAGDEVVGSITVIRRRLEHPVLDTVDREIVEDLAHHVGLAIGNAQLREALQLEIARRTAAERALVHHQQIQNVEDRAVQAAVFLDAIVENIPDMVFVKDADQLAFVRFNRAGEQLLGMSRDELIGKTDYEFFPRDEAEFFIQKDREALASKGVVEILEEPIQTRTGPRWLHTKKVSLVDANGQPRYLLGISHDITDRKRAELRLRTAKESAETASRDLDAFASSVAHDLRAPLRGVIGFSEALLEDCLEQLDERGRGHLRRLSDAANRMATLIDDLLGLSRVSQVDLHRERIDLGALAHTTSSSLKRTDPERRAEVVIQPGLVVEADRRMLAIVLDNLFGNAWKFTANAPAARIEVGAMKRDDATVFYVRDNGAGFDMAYADKLFGVFQRLHTEAEFPGSGVGLATVARIVRRHNGNVWAEGVVGQGATFYFTLGEATQ